MPDDLPETPCVTAAAAQLLGGGSVGKPIMIRVDGTLLPLNDEILKPQDTKELLFSILKEEQKEKLIKTERFRLPPSSVPSA